MSEEKKGKIVTKTIQEETIEVQEILTDDFNYSSSYGHAQSVKKSWVDKFNELSKRVNILDHKQMEYTPTRQSGTSQEIKASATCLWVKYETTTSRIVKSLGA